MTQYLELQHHGQSVSVPVADRVALEQLGQGRPAGAMTAAAIASDAAMPAGQAVEQSAGQPPGQPTEQATGQGVAAEALVRRVMATLRQPERFLPLTDMLVPGDHLAIALQTGVPQATEVIQAVLQVVADCQLGKVEIVVSESMEPIDRDRLRAALPGSVLLTVHRLGDRSSVRYLAADDQAEAIRLSSSVVDADLVLPINVMRTNDPLAGGPSSDALFPGLIDDGQSERLQRAVLRQIAQADGDGQQRQRGGSRWAADQSEQIRWALGVQLMLAVEVDSSGQAGRVIATTPAMLAEMIEQHLTAQYSLDGAAAELVVACVDGDASQHNLDNLARAALAARGYAAAGGAIVLVSDLAQLPRADHDGAAFASKLLSELVNQIDVSRRYLLWSCCEGEQVESFGFGVVPDAAALSRLIDQTGHCCLIRVAQTAPHADRAFAD